MSEVISKIYESAIDRDAQEQFARLGHVAIANVYDPSLGELAASVIDNTTRYRMSGNLSGQIGDVRFRHLDFNNPLKQVVLSIASSLNQLSDGSENITYEDLSAHAIDHRPGAKGLLHQDGGLAVATLKGVSRLEFADDGRNIDTSYELIPGRIVVMDNSRRLWHRGVAGNESSRTGLVIHPRAGTRSS